MQETSLDETAAAALFADAEEDLRVAIVMHRAASDAESARAALEQSSHVIEKAVEKLCGR
jgi:N-acetylmuramic acid 6-phosphate (MurNAc-6-P) etherase